MIYSLDQFTRHGDSLVAEASDLNARGRDEHVLIRSHFTGRVVRFIFSRTEMTPDGEDIAGWHYTADPRGPVVKTPRVLIIND